MSAREWLDARPAMPPTLRRAVEAALDRSGGGSARAGAVPASGGGAAENTGVAAVADELADELADAALEVLGRVAGAVPERSTAAELLAADALLTYACEAAAEAGPESLERLTARLDYGRFAALLERAGREGR